MVTNNVKLSLSDFMNIVNYSPASNSIRQILTCFLFWLKAAMYQHTYLYTQEMFGVKVDVTRTKPTSLRISHASFDPFPILPLKEMVSDPILKITLSLP